MQLKEQQRADQIPEVECICGLKMVFEWTFRSSCQ
jgi:hypothetical protein